MSNPYDPHNAPTEFPGGGQQPPPPQYPPPPQQPPPTLPLPEQPHPTQQFPQQPQQPYPPQQQYPPGPGGGYGAGPGGPGFGAPGGYGAPGFGGPPKKSKTPLIIGAAVLAFVLIVGAIVGGVVLLGGDDDTDKASDDSSQSEEPSESEEPSTEATPESVTPETSDIPSEPESPSAPVDPNGDLTAITGFWNGTYTCAQGETKLTLTIAPNGAGDGLDAVFDFSPTAGSSTPAGSFLMAGTLTDGVLFLEGTDWINQPDDYLLVNLQADVPDASTDRITGEVLDPNCTTFDVSR